MADQSILNLSSSEWQAIAAIATAFGAIASAVAATTAVWIANRSSTPSAKLSVGDVLMFSADPRSPEHEYVRFKIVNTGERAVNIVQIGWTAGWSIKGFGTKKVALQMFELSISDCLPIALAHGEQATWMIPLRHDDRDWISHFATNFLTPNRWLMLRTLKAHAYTSTGHRFDVRPDQSLLDRFENVIT